MVALLNESAAQTRVQPAFQIDNWYGTKTPKYVYLNGTRLVPNVGLRGGLGVYAGNGARLQPVLQVNKVLTGADQTLFVDDNDSSGFMGEAARMKSLTIVRHGQRQDRHQELRRHRLRSATSGQWYLELDLNGWTTPHGQPVTDTGFGEFNVLEGRRHQSQRGRLLRHPAGGPRRRGGPQPGPHEVRRCRHQRDVCPRRRAMPARPISPIP